MNKSLTEIYENMNKHWNKMRKTFYDKKTEIESIKNPKGRKIRNE